MKPSENLASACLDKVIFLVQIPLGSPVSFLIQLLIILTRFCCNAAATRIPVQERPHACADGETPEEAVLGGHDARTGPLAGPLAGLRH
jgi:hypothetical protein